MASKRPNIKTVTFRQITAMEDLYLTLEGPSEGIFKDRGSKFFAYAYPAFSVEACQQYLDDVKQMHPKARHHCYAYRIGLDGNVFRANDDGEPSGSAGRPILGQIDSFNVTNVFIVVVRYFGGTKLGVPGLINAYKTGAADALNNGVIIEKIVQDVYSIDFEYSLMSNVMNAVKKLELEVLKQQFETNGHLEIAIRKSETQQKLDLLRAAVAQVRIEEIEKVEKIEGFELNYLSTQ